MLRVQGHDLRPIVEILHGIVVSGKDVSSFGINPDVAEALLPVSLHFNFVERFVELIPSADGDALRAEVFRSDPNTTFEVGHGDDLVEFVCIEHDKNIQGFLLFSTFSFLIFNFLNPLYF